MDDIFSFVHCWDGQMEGVSGQYAALPWVPAELIKPTAQPSHWCYPMLTDNMEPTKAGLGAPEHSTFLKPAEMQVV